MKLEININQKIGVINITSNSFVLEDLKAHICKKINVTPSDYKMKMILGDTPRVELIEAKETLEEFIDRLGIKKVEDYYNNHGVNYAYLYKGYLIQRPYGQTIFSMPRSGDIKKKPNGALYLENYNGGVKKGLQPYGDMKLIECVELIDSGDLSGNNYYGKPSYLEFLKDKTFLTDRNIELICKLFDYGAVKYNEKLIPKSKIVKDGKEDRELRKVYKVLSDLEIIYSTPSNGYHSKVLMAKEFLETIKGIR